MAVPAFTHKHDAHVLQYTSGQGTPNNIVIEHVSAYATRQDDTLTITTQNDFHDLKFDTVEARDAAQELLIEALASHYASATISEKMSDGELFQLNITNRAVNILGTLEVFIIVPIGITLNLFVDIAHGGDISEEFYKNASSSALGPALKPRSRNTVKTQSPTSTFYKNPTISDIGTLDDETLHLGVNGLTQTNKRILIPNYVLGNGTYVLRAENITPYFTPISWHLQFWETPA